MVGSQDGGPRNQAPGSRGTPEPSQEAADRESRRSSSLACPSTVTRTSGIHETSVHQPHFRAQRPVSRMTDPSPLGWDFKPPDAKPYQIVGYTEPAMETSPPREDALSRQVHSRGIIGGSPQFDGDVSSVNYLFFVIKSLNSRSSMPTMMHVVNDEFVVFLLRRMFHLVGRRLLNIIIDVDSSAPRLIHSPLANLITEPDSRWIGRFQTPIG